MKKALLFCIFLMSALFLRAQNYTIRQNTMSKLSIEFSTPKLQTQVVQVGDACYATLTMDGYGHSAKVGEPRHCPNSTS